MAETPTDDDAPSNESPALPFFDVSWNYGAEVRVRAGWTRDGELDTLAIDALVPINEAGDQINTAHAWAARRWQEILDRTVGGEELEAEPEA